MRANELYVEHDNVITPAGSSAGIDACLHLVRKDYGADVANSVARRLVMHPHRQGGQAQFIEQPLPKEQGRHRLSQLMDELRINIAAKHTIKSMAELAFMSERTFQRQFLAATGVPVKQWLVQERIARACVLLETSELSIEQVSEEVGFSSHEVLRYHFNKVLSVSPLAYRRQFKRQATVV